MPADWIQARDSAFQSQVDDLVAFIANHATVWGVRADELLPLQQCRQEFDQAMAEQGEQAALYHAAVAQKQAKREELERTLRQMVRRINNHPAMTEELRETGRLNPRERKKEKQ